MESRAMPTAPAPDLWPTDLFGSLPATAPTPITILKQQGRALGAHTHNFVYGEVETSTSDDGKRFSHALCLVAPFLRYRKPLLSVNHGLQPYPANVIESSLTKKDASYWTKQVGNEQELQDALREFFNEPRVKEVLRSVIDLSNDVAPPDGE